MTKYSILMCAALLIDGFTAVVDAQGSDDSLAVMRATSQFIILRHPADSIVVNERAVAERQAPPDLRLGRQRPTARTSELAASVGAGRGELDSVLRCTGSPPRCRMSALFISMSDPRFRSDSVAELTATAVYAAGPRGEPSYETLHLTLRREAKGWVVMSIEELGIS